MKIFEKLAKYGGNQLKFCKSQKILKYIRILVLIQSKYGNKNRKVVKNITKSKNGEK